MKTDARGSCAGGSRRSRDPCNAVGRSGRAGGGAPKIGSSLIGKLEGPKIVLDAKTFPKAFKEAPQLAAQVKAGKLPAVAKRLPEPSQLFVVKPLQEWEIWLQLAPGLYRTGRP
ncbi:MAG: hypothetical protein IPI73_13245 [Betaproteobacteria bacterium]|nr:hypothetical protein [Betaproteobacteria bacterium]